MKKLLLLLLFITALSNAQIVNIPDANFKAKLLEADVTNQIALNNGFSVKIDVNNDGEIQVAEIQDITELRLSNSSISSLTGIEYFTSLFFLDCSINQLTSLNVSQNIYLDSLYCNQNQLTNLNIYECSALSFIDCSTNQLSDLGLSPSANLVWLECSANALTSLYIIPQCTNLVSLYCSNNQLSNLDVTQNVNLTRLACNGNQLSNLNFSQNLSLQELHCEYNQLTNLDITQNLNLTILSCNNNQITSLNVSQNINLFALLCSFNQLSNLDVTNNVNLTDLYCGNNLLSNIDVSQNTLLTQFRCGYNQLTTIDVSQNTKLSLFTCEHNQLVSVDVTHNTNLDYFTCNDSDLLQTLFIKNGRNENLFLANTPNLTYICADEGQIESTQALVGVNVLVSSYCSFTPGGNYNTVSGEVRFDMDNNGCDSNDFLLPNSVHVNLTNGTVTSEVFPNTNGNYLLYTTTGNHTLSTILENPSYFTVTPSSSTFDFPLLDNSSQTQNFCVSANGIHPDAEIVITPITVASPGFDATYKIVYKNKGNQTLSGNINFAFNDLVLDFVSASVVPNSASLGNLNWNYTNLLPFESRSITITLNVNSPTETPAVNPGDVLHYSATINPVSGDELPLDNTFAYNQTVVGSFDPNDKTCLEGNVVSPTKIGDYLHYNINFENTGTAAATFVVVKDMIDTTKFDINSLQIMNSSHPMTTRITGNKVEFIFDNINLGANQHGNVTFKIKTKSTLVTGTTVTNKADIYFDYNAPVVTNIASTTFQTLSNGDFELDNSVAIAPNPTKNTITINCNTSIKSIQLFDVQGRVLTTQIVNETQSSIAISNYTNGIYFVKVTTEKGSKVDKIIKE
jgi:uncharacterized repeat protein (TIGR01451 family)